MMPDQPETPKTIPVKRREEPIFIRVAKSIFWSFFGIRKQQDYDADQKDIKAQYIAIGGFMGAIALILGLVLLVKLVTHK